MSQRRCDNKPCNKKAVSKIIKRGHKQPFCLCGDCDEAYWEQVYLTGKYPDKTATIQPATGGYPEGEK